MMDEGLPNVADAHTIEIEQLKFEEEIGSGSFGSVYKGSFLGTPVAIKMIAKSEDLKQELDIFVQREKAMTKYSHPHLVQFIGVSSQDVYLYLVTEYVPGGDLRRYLKNPAIDISWKLRVQIAADVARALAFLHSKKIMHRDLKSKNLLVDANWKIKVCDFGFARAFQPKKRSYTLCGTEDWMAPEIIMGMDYDEKVDIFSYGIVLCEVITRRKIANDLQRSPEEAFCLNIERCAEYESDKRPSAIEILGVLAGLDKDLQEGKSVSRAGSRIEAQPTVVKPEILEPATTLAKPATTTVEKTQKVLAPKSKFAILKRSQSTRRMEIKEAHSVAKMDSLTFDNPDDFYAAIEQFTASSFRGWLLIGYHSDRKLTLQAFGQSFDELVPLLGDDQVQYMLTRIEVQDSSKRMPTCRDVFIMWTGSKVGVVQAGKKKSHVGEVKKILQPFHAELTAVSKEAFTLANIIAKSDPLSGSHVID